MIRDNFPKSNDVEQAVTFRTTSYVETKKYFQSKGLIHIGNNKDDLSKSVSGFFWSHKDYLYLRNLTQGISSGSNISGFILESNSVSLELDVIKNDLLSFIKRMSVKDDKMNTRSSNSHSLNMPAISNGLISSILKYERIIPGRIELMKRIESTVSFSIERINSRKWQLICFPKANKDVQMLELLFKNTTHSLYSPSKISLDNFSQEDKIRFFDEVLDYYNRSPDWQLRQVTGITVRRKPALDIEERGIDRTLFYDFNNESDSEEEGEEEEEVREMPRDDLTSINQAILEGSHLRHNSFVKDCEKQGFYFTSMTLALEKPDSSEFVSVTIRFKLSPKLFEVVLNKFGVKNELGVEELKELEVNTFTQKRLKEILKEVWKITHEIWDRIDLESKTGNPLQLILADVETDETA